MTNPLELKFGICEPGVRHASTDEPKSIEEKFQLIQNAGAFDYLDVTPPPEEVDEYVRCSEKYGIPVLAGSCNYILGLEDQKLFQNLSIGAQLGSIVHNTQVFMDHADGHLLSNDEIVRFYLQAYEWGEKTSCVPTFEVHVNMWSEKFTRILEVANAVEQQGITFNMTLDHSHVVFKINNETEQQVFGLNQLLEQGELELNPQVSGNIYEQWISRGLVRHAHARSVAPNNPKNIWGKHPDINNLRSSLHPQNTIGRGIQYPFIKPEPNQWHSDWNEADLDTWKHVARMLLRHHASDPNSQLQTLSTEFIPFTDYGEGSTYSLLDNNAACARWLRQEWQQLKSTM